VPDPLRVSLCGEVDIALEDSLDAVMSFVSHSARSDVAICLHDVTFLDSTGLDFLVRLQEYVATVGCGLRVIAPSPAVRWVLRIAGLLEAFDVEDPDTPPDFCACHQSRIDGVRVLLATHYSRGLQDNSGATG
jgi:anti-anti-sigma factor